MFIKISFYVLGGLLLLFCSTLLIASLPLLLFGVHFLPSQDWVVRTAPTASYVGIAFVAYSSTVMIACVLKHPASLAQANFGKHPKFKFVVAILFLGLAAWFACKILVENVVPMSHAAVAGTKVFLPYTVEDPQYYYRSRRCRSAIKLGGMPGWSNFLCGVPGSLRNALSKGDTIYVVGHGTPNGVFYTGFALSPGD